MVVEGRVHLGHLGLPAIKWARWNSPLHQAVPIRQPMSLAAIAVGFWRAEFHLGHLGLPAIEWARWNSPLQHPLLICFCWGAGYGIRQ